MMIRLLVAVTVLAAVSIAHAQSPGKPLRFPDIHGDRIAFVHAGDIYIVGASGGTAQRLTSHEGMELYPKFSPDGEWLAFSAEYNGTRQVYVMPSAGGEPRQLTWYNDIGPQPLRGGTDYRVLDWTRDGRHVVVRANRTPTRIRSGRPYLIPVDGGMEVPLAIPETGGGMLSPDGAKFVYTPLDDDFRSWKRYRGGLAQDVWIYDLNNNSSQRLTQSRATNHAPMWIGETIYFVSDRDYTFNLYAMSSSGGEPRKLTHFDEYDVLWPSAGPDSLVFERGGAIWRFDPASGRAEEVPIRVIGDFPETQPRYVKAGSFIESFDIAPDGNRAVFGARGEVFTLPAKYGEPRNVSNTPDHRERSVTWSPDGRWIAYLSDASGEYELYVRAQDGSGEPRRITRDGDIWKFPPVWSPDSSKIAFADKRQRLHIVEVGSGRISEVDTSTREDITEYRWSPDSRWLAYVKTAERRNPSIWVHSIGERRNYRLTDGTAEDHQPVFDPEGRYLYFLSDRDYNRTYSAYESTWLYYSATRIFAVPLRADQPALFPPKSDEVAIGEPVEAKTVAKEKNATKPAPVVRIDVEGFNARARPLNAPAGNYSRLQANAAGVFVVSASGNSPGSLHMLALDESDKLKKIADEIDGYALSANGKKLLLRRGERFAIVDAAPEADFDKGKLALERWEIRIEPRQEWRQLFADAWRTLRDWFYDPGMHGQDWNAVRARYEALLPNVNSRADLDYLLTEIAGEANAGHVYVESGDQRKVERRAGGLLGAEIEAHESGYFRVARVFSRNSSDASTRSPLAEHGVNVADGEFILAVDGVDARSVRNFYQLLENKAERVVTLRVNRRPAEPDAREVRVKTIASEQNLRYTDWVQQRRAMVDALSGGRIGYIHVPNTSVVGHQELIKGMGAYADKDALIIDDRYNAGGNIPDRLAELLAREPLNYWKSRGLEPSPTPLLHHAGPKVMLINSYSGSGGDALPYYFRKLGVGPLIGTRTWGGLIGNSGSPRLADNGTITAAAFRFMDTDGKWAVENEGVAPDVEVIDRPELVAAGRDPSVEKAVEMLLETLARTPKSQLSVPSAPTKFPPPGE
ncbi:S41 family peptidase [Steroidobacter cummioxidans]|uniref:S41 family peptidase n=1 Tax=Steroidobacter cummioxidans TaxID=1803913 RepID=UPI000E30FF30|nr:S41 family peptidase [Steroidobacter cummioxidans]